MRLTRSFWISTSCCPAASGWRSPRPDSLTCFQRAEDNDFYAYRGQGQYKLTLSPGDFLVVFPGDAHKIKMQVDGPRTVTKAVFKIRIH